ncbi:hypothetical protein KKD52_01750 [Myxococcota bacterium]|nr:hypothetical protein [Myxococcota bacterium]MBU1410981.1 hypothetical protein [Myxococcota bacterium]MBU1509057.1 hypothetical protein [Myxococcota bacterium]
MKMRHLFVSMLLASAFTVGCAASPEDVCDHTAKLMAKEMPAEADKAKSEEVVKKFKEECVKSVKKRKENMGYFKYRTQSRCIMDASTLAAATKCK